MKIIAGVMVMLMLTIGAITSSYAGRYYCPPPRNYYHYYPRRYYRQHRSYYGRRYRAGHYRYSPRVERYYYYQPYSETWGTAVPTTEYVVEEQMY